MRPDPTHAEISARAHAIWLARGGTPGRSLDDWLQAERELRGGTAARVAAPAAAPSRPTPSSSFAPPPAPVSPHGAPPPRPPAAPVSSFAPPLASKPSGKPSPAPRTGGGGGGKTKKNKKRK